MAISRRWVSLLVCCSSPKMAGGPLRAALTAALSRRLKTGVGQEDAATLRGSTIQHKFCFLPVTSQVSPPSAKNKKTNLSMLMWSSYPASLIYEDLTRRGPSAEAAGLARAFWRLDLLQDGGNPPEMPLRGQLRLLIHQGWPPQPFRRPHHTLRSLTSFP